MDINKSPTLARYKNDMKQVLMLYYPDASPRDLDAAIDYSIAKRIKDANVKLSNSYKRYKVVEDDQLVYKNFEQNVGLLQLSDYILSRQPIVTAYGSMFIHHGTVPNPLASVVQSFLDNRTVHKKQMLACPKGSEDFEKYNLLQLLDKIDKPLCPII